MIVAASVLMMHVGGMCVGVRHRFIHVQVAMASYNACIACQIRDKALSRSFCILHLALDVL